MNRRQMIATCTALPALSALAPATAQTTTLLSPPRPRKVPTRIEQLGRVRVDEYAWMRDEQWQKVLADPALLNADIRTHLEAENAYFDGVMAPTAGLQEQLFEEMKGRSKLDDSSVPMPYGPYEYYVRYETGGQHPVHARKRRAGKAAEEVLLNVDERARGHAYFSTGVVMATPNHRHFVWAEDTVGAEAYRIFVRDLGSGGGGYRRRRLRREL